MNENMKVEIDPIFEKFVKEAKDSKNKPKLLYLTGKSIIVNKVENRYAEAFEMLKQAARLGFTKAMFELAKCYEFGIGTKKNITSAISWYKDTDDSITEDVWDKQRCYGAFQNKQTMREYNTNPELRQMADEAAKAREEMTFEDYLELAKEGDADAQMVVGHTYYYGNMNVAKDVQKAVEWWEKAAENGHKGAMMNVADYYIKAGDKAKGAVWLRRYIEKRIVWRDMYLYGYIEQENL